MHGHALHCMIGTLQRATAPSGRRSSTSCPSGCAALASAVMQAWHRPPSGWPCSQHSSACQKPRPLLIMSCVLSWGVPRNRCSTLMHGGLSQRCSTLMPAGIWPCTYIHASLCASAERLAFLSHRLPYPSLLRAPVCSMQPSGMALPHRPIRVRSAASASTASSMTMNQPCVSVMSDPPSAGACCVAGLGACASPVPGLRWVRL